MSQKNPLNPSRYSSLLSWIFLFQNYLPIQNVLRVSWWLSGLRIRHCHCSGSGCCCGVDLIPGPGTFICCGRGQTPNKTNQQKRLVRLCKRLCIPNINQPHSNGNKAHLFPTATAHIYMDIHRELQLQLVNNLFLLLWSSFPRMATSSTWAWEWLRTFTRSLGWLLLETNK